MWPTNFVKSLGCIYRAGVQSLPILLGKIGCLSNPKHGMTARAVRFESKLLFVVLMTFIDFI
jgi:hypothetical protein